MPNTCITSKHNSPRYIDGFSKITPTTCNSLRRSSLLQSNLFRGDRGSTVPLSSNESTQVGSICHSCLHYTIFSSQHDVQQPGVEILRENGMIHVIFDRPCNTGRTRLDANQTQYGAGRCMPLEILSTRTCRPLFALLWRDPTLFSRSPLFGPSPLYCGRSMSDLTVSGKSSAAECNYINFGTENRDYNEPSCKSTQWKK